MTTRAVVAGVGHYLPDRIVTNAELATRVDTSDEWIRSRSGIERRHVAADGQTTSDMAIRAARAGMRTDELDGVARRVIVDAGLGDAFAHGLGHGIGLQTHEWPRVSYNRQDVLPEGAAITIEPGVYLEGRFGVRIEDIVVLGADGCRNLTRTPKELLIV